MIRTLKRCQSLLLDPVTVRRTNTARMRSIWSAVASLISHRFRIAIGSAGGVKRELV
jgi:hypothetical protein